MVGPKKQDFWPKINILKGNHCILRIRGAPVCQKLGTILENKVVQKLNLENSVFTKNWSLKLICMYYQMKKIFTFFVDFLQSMILVLFDKPLFFGGIKKKSFDYVES